MTDPHEIRTRTMEKIDPGKLPANPGPHTMTICCPVCDWKLTIPPPAPHPFFMAPKEGDRLLIAGPSVEQCELQLGTHFTSHGIKEWVTAVETARRERDQLAARLVEIEKMQRALDELPKRIIMLCQPLQSQQEKPG